MFEYRKKLKYYIIEKKEGKEVFMKKEERLEEITKLINKRGTIRVTEVVERLKVSDMTVRRDLTELEGLGVLTTYSRWG